MLDTVNNVDMGVALDQFIFLGKESLKTFNLYKVQFRILDRDALIGRYNVPNACNPCTQGLGATSLAIGHAVYGSSKDQLNYNAILLGGSIDNGGSIQPILVYFYQN